MMGGADSAKVLNREAIELDPQRWQAYEGLALVLERDGQLDDARDLLTQAVPLAGRTARAKAGLARVLARSKRMVDAASLLKELRAQATATGVYDPIVASALFAAGDTAAAFDWLEAAYRQRHPHMSRLTADPSFDTLRRDPRFQAIMRRVGLGR